MKAKQLGSPDYTPYTVTGKTVDEINKRIRKAVGGGYYCYTRKRSAN